MLELSRSLLPIDAECGGRVRTASRPQEARAALSPAWRHPRVHLDEFGDLLCQALAAAVNAIMRGVPL